MPLIDMLSTSVADLRVHVDVRFTAQKLFSSRVEDEIRSLGDQISVLEGSMNAAIEGVTQMSAAMAVGFEENLRFMQSLATLESDPHRGGREVELNRSEESYQHWYAGDVSPVPQWLHDLANLLL